MLWRIFPQHLHFALPLQRQTLRVVERPPSNPPEVKDMWLLLHLEGGVWSTARFSLLISEFVNYYNLAPYHSRIVMCRLRLEALSQPKPALESQAKPEPC